MTGAVLEIDDSNFNDTIGDGVTLVDFFADWCGPCRIIAPIIQELAEEFKGQAKIAKLDVDKAQETATQYQVTSIPTLIFFKQGTEIERIIGIRDKETLKKMLSAII